MSNILGKTTPITKTVRFTLITTAFIIAALLLTNYIFYNNQATKRSKAAGDTVSLNFTPATVTAGTGASYTVTIQAKPTVDLSVVGYKLTIPFDKTKTQLTNIGYNLGTVSFGLGDDNSNLSTVNSNGVVKLQSEIQSPDGFLLASSTQKPIVSLTFTSLTAGSYSTAVNSDSSSFFTKLNPDLILSNIAVGGATLSVNGITNSPTPTRTPTPRSPTSTHTPTSTSLPSNTPLPTVIITPSGNIQINLKLKFQGINKKPDDLRNRLYVKLTLVSESDNQYQSYALFTADVKGIFSGSGFFNVGAEKLTGKYKILIKGPMHLQKQICSAVPTEGKEGSYQCDVPNIILQLGSNSFDFSKIYLLAGDLPEQDGIINSYDFSLVRQKLGTVALSNQVGDVNLDGIVDTQDYSLIIYSLMTKFDD